MDTYFAVLEKPGKYRLLLADDDEDVYNALQAAPWRELTDDVFDDGLRSERREKSSWQALSEEEAIRAYASPGSETVVFLLDSSIVKESGAGVSVSEWIASWKQSLFADQYRVLMLYSGEPFNHELFHRSYAKTGNPWEDLKQIILLLKNETPLSEWPLKLAHPNNELSRIIHALQNLFLPVTLDAETLEELSRPPNQATMAEVFSDHFAPSASAYLSSQSQQHEGGDILRRVDALCESLGPDVDLEIKREKSAIASAVNSARHAFEQHASSDSNCTTLPGLNDLQARLRGIADAGDVLIRALREIRKKKQGDAK